MPTPIINAGDGTHEHPTQALLDARTILDRRPTLEGLKRRHHRRHRAQPGGALQYVLALEIRRADRAVRTRVVCCRRSLTKLAPNISLTHKMEDAIRDADVIMMLRVQLERQHEAAFSANEYFQFYGLRLEHMSLAKPDAIVMHPGPINRGREISSEVADSQRSVILNQVENGIAVRMAVLERILGN